MNCPQQSWPADRWVDYLDGAMAAPDRAAMELHFSGCAKCRTLCVQLRQVGGNLLKRGEQAAQENLISERSLARIWDGVRFRIRRAIAPETAQPRVRLEQLRSILVSICGSATADDAMRTAEFGCRDQSEPFLRNLGSMVETLSGDRAAQLVEEAARRVRRAQLA